MNVIQVTRQSGTPYYIPTSQIVAFESNGKGGTLIQVAHMVIDVRETPADIIDLAANGHYYIGAAA